MWPTCLTGDVFLCTLNGIYFNQRVMNTFHYQFQEGIAEVNVEEVMDAINAEFSVATTGLIDRYRSAVSDSYTLDELWIQRIYPVRLVKKVYPKNLVGLITDVPLCSNIQASITRKSLLSGRRYIGGIRIPAPQDASVSVDGVLTAGYQGVLSGLASVMKDSITVIASGTGEVDPVIYHPGGDPVTSTIFETEHQPEVRTMNRRTVGRGI